MARTRKAKKGGKAIKLSHELIAKLKAKRNRGESFDAVIRRMMGMPTRTGKKQPLRHFYVLTRPEVAIFNDLPAARGESMIRAAVEGKRRAEKPIKVTESV